MKTGSLAQPFEEPAEQMFFRAVVNDALHFELFSLTTMNDCQDDMRPTMTVTCNHLATHIQEIQPSATPQDVARLCLLLTNNVENIDNLEELGYLREAWKQMGLKLQVATDQHAAMTEELETLASSEPKDFDQEQIWVLIRAIKVQSQILQMYVGHPLLDV